jgi:uncharacterized protein YecT (DUF1311 family)
MTNEARTACCESGRKVGALRHHAENDFALRRRRNEGKNGRIIAMVGLGAVLLALIPTPAFSQDTPPKRCELVPEAWAPSLDQVWEYVEEKSKSETTTSQRVLTQTSANLADLRDAQLFIAYVRLMQTLDVKEQGELFEEQRRWLSKRGESARASVTSKGGTLAPLEYSGAFEKITEQRLAELRRRLQRQGTATQERKEKSKP